MKVDEFGLTRRDALALDAAKFYAAGMRQQEIAERLHVTRPTVSKLMTHAKHRGFLRVTVIDPRENDERLTRQLQERFKINEVKLVAPLGAGPVDLRRALGRAGAEMLPRLLTEDDVVGFAWSETINELVAALAPQRLMNLSVVQVRGGMGNQHVDSRIAASFARIGQVWNARTFTAQAPAISATFEKHQSELQNPALKDVLSTAAQARVVVYSVGSCTETSTLFRSNLLSDQERATLSEIAAGDICSHFVDAAGRVCLPDLNRRALGYSLPELRKIEQRVLVAGGPDKVSVIRAALTCGYANRLVTDIATAKSVLSAASS